MVINTKIAKILSAGKILTASLLGMNNTAQAVPYGDVHTYPTDNWDRSTGNSIIWHPHKDNSLTISLFGPKGTDYLSVYRILDIDTEEILVGFTPFLQGTFPENGRFTKVLDDLDLSGFANQKIQFFMIYTGSSYYYGSSGYSRIRMSEIDNICVSDVYVNCTGS
jgi:hypothetical protein